MSKATIITIIIIIAVAIGGVAWVCFALLKRAKKAYWDLYHNVVKVEQQIGQTQQITEQKIDEVKQQIGQVQHHLLLEHLAGVSTRAKDNDLISVDTYDKSMQLFHELEMDNFQGKTLPEKKI